jgi:hypothetical protein
LVASTVIVIGDWSEGNWGDQLKSWLFAVIMHTKKKSVNVNLIFKCFVRHTFKMCKFYTILAIFLNAKTNGLLN